jgi:hypothetical protein
MCCSVSSFDLLYYDNECMTTGIRSLSYAFMEMNISVGPDVSGMTFCATCIDPRVRTSQGHSRLCSLPLSSYVCDRDVYLYAIEKDKDGA